MLAATRQRRRGTDDAPCVRAEITKLAQTLWAHALKIRRCTTTLRQRRQSTTTTATMTTMAMGGDEEYSAGLCMDHRDERWSTRNGLYALLWSMSRWVGLVGVMVVRYVYSVGLRVRREMRWHASPACAAGFAGWFGLNAWISMMSDAHRLCLEIACWVGGGMCGCCNGCIRVGSVLLA